MARRVKIAGAVLNIRLHPHPVGIYGQFMQAIYGLKKAVQLRGERYAMFSLLNRTEENNGIYTGFVTAFTKIDMSEPWFDASNLTEASDADVSKISIPDGLYPNANSFHFLFDANNHRFYLQTYSNGKTISPLSAQKLLQGLASDLQITKKYNEASIDIVQSKAGLDAVFSLPVIKRITITINKPNADVFEDDFDEKVEGFLEELNSRTMTLIVEADSGKSITPNAGLRRVGVSALDHGSVRTEGRDARGSTQRSTENFPEPLHDKYDREQKSESEAFRKMTGR